MNFCTNCGSELKNSDNYCTKCGNKVKKIKESQDFILIFGIFLVLFASFALGIISWKIMSEILRISFFIFETILFFVLSFILKKIGNKLYRLFYIIGLVLVPYTLSLIPYYHLLTSYFNKLPGLSVYLAVIYFIIFLIYILINYNFKSKFVDYLSLFALFISFVNIGLIFNCTYSVIILLVSIYISIINIISNYDFFNNNVKNVLKNTASIMIILIVPFILVLFNIKDGYNNILNLIVLILYLFNGYIKLYKKSDFFGAILPFIFSILIYTFVGLNFSSYNNLCLYVISLLSVILYFVSNLFNNKVFNIITLIITYLTLYFLISICITSKDLILLIISFITFLLNIYNIIVSKYNKFNFLLPINIFILIIGLTRLCFNLDMIYIYLLASFIFTLIYCILKIYDNEYSLTYLITSYLLSMISTYNIAFGFNSINLLIVLSLFLIFVLLNIFKENIVEKVMVFISLNIVTILLFHNLENGLYYGLLTISGLTLIGSLLLSYIKNIDLKPYILYSEILVFIITLFNNMNYSSYILFINVFIFALSYLSIIKFFNIKWYRILYIMLGLLTVIRVIGIIINVIQIASIISIISILIIITIMYLLETKDNISLAIISIVLLFPYYTLVYNTLGYVRELYLLPLVIYDIVFTEIIKFKNENNKKLWTIIPLSIISYFFIILGNGIETIIMDIIISLIFILLGLYRKYNYLIYFGSSFMIFTIFIRLFSILNSIAIVLLLIIVGFILIGVALYNELKKKNSNE